MNAAKWNMRNVLLAITLILCLPFISPVAMAQDSDSPPETTAESSENIRFVLQPAADPGAGFIDDLEIAPGASAGVDVAVRNTGDVPVVLRLYMTNAWNGTNGGFSAGTIEEELAGPATWIEFPTQEISLNAGEQQDVTLTISVPTDALPGQYISALVAETADTIPIPGATVLDHRVRYAMSVGVLVPGDLTPNFELGEPTVEDNAIRIPISNGGNYLVRPEGDVRLVNESGDEVINSEIQLGSVYAGNSTSVAIALPEQLPSGDYTFDLSLTDPGSGISGQIESAEVFVPEPVDPTGLSISAHTLTPNAEPIVLLDVNATVVNGGNQIPAANVLLEVSRDGEVTESFSLATNQILFTGENQIASRYIPEDGTWESGTYTFAIIVSSVNPNDGQEIQLLNHPLEDEIVVP